MYPRGEDIYVYIFRTTMIFLVSRYLYFLLLLAFLVIVFVSRIFPGEVIGQNIVFIYSILLLPLIDLCIESLKKESSRCNWKLTGGGLLKITLASIIILIFYKRGVEPFSLMMLGYFVLGIMFRFNSRIAFFASMICFAYVALYLLIENKKMAEAVSIYAYYYLIIGVIHQIYEIICKKNNTDMNEGLVSEQLEPLEQ